MLTGRGTKEGTGGQGEHTKRQGPYGQGHERRVQSDRQSTGRGRGGFHRQAHDKMHKAIAVKEGPVELGRGGAHTGRCTERVQRAAGKAQREEGRAKRDGREQRETGESGGALTGRCTKECTERRGRHRERGGGGAKGEGRGRLPAGARMRARSRRGAGEGGSPARHLPAARAGGQCGERSCVCRGEPP